LDRWIDDDRREEVWKPLKGIVPAPDFIKSVITARRAAQASVNRMFGTSKARHVPGWKEWLEEVRDALSGPAHKLHPLAVAEFLDKRGLDARYFYGSLFEEELPEFSQKAGDKVTRARKLFIQSMVNYFVDVLDRPFFEGVATLAEIAFSGELLCAEDVANALKSTTSRRRSKTAQ